MFNNRNETLLTLAIIFLLALIIIQSIFFLKNKKDQLLLYSDVDSLTHAIEEKKNTIDIQQQRIIADSFFMEGKIDSAHIYYQKIQSFYQDVIDHFHERIGKKNQMESDQISREQLIAVLKIEKEQLLGIIEDRSMRIDSLLEERKLLSDSKLEQHLAFISKEQMLIDSIQEINERVESIMNTTKDLLIFEKGNNNTVYYLGETQDSMANGFGIGLWKSGGIYKGQWKDNLRHGKGHYTWKDGEFYEGDFFMDSRHGMGKYVWKNGIYFIGGWREDSRHGEGVLYEKNGDIRLKGVWAMDEYKKSES